MSPVPPVWARLIFRLGSSCTIFWIMVSGGRAGPKSLLPIFAFQVPLKSDFACAWTNPRASVQIAREKSRIVRLRTETLLLLVEYFFHVAFAHGAGEVLRDGQSFPIARKAPARLGGKFGAAEGAFGLDHQLVAVPFQRTLEFALAYVIHAFLAVRGVAEVVGHVSLHTPGGGDIRLQDGIGVRDLLGDAVRRRHLAEIALTRVQFPSAAEICFGLGLDHSKGQSHKCQGKKFGVLPGRKAAHKASF